MPAGQSLAPAAHSVAAAFAVASSAMVGGWAVLMATTASGWPAPAVVLMLWKSQASLAETAATRATPAERAVRIFCILASIWREENRLARQCMPRTTARNPAPFNNQ